MGTLLFGRDETTTCIIDVAVVGKDHEPLCLAYKTTKTFVGAGVWLTDDGYVLKPRAQSSGKGIYYPVTNAELREMQDAGDLPSPLPAYAIPFGEWAIATSLYWVVAFCVLASFVTGRFRKRWRKERDAEIAERRVSFGPPVLRTKEDRFVDEQLRAVLEPGERILHQAFALDRHPDSYGGYRVPGAVYAALTSHRLLFAHAKPGLRALRPVARVEAIERERLAGVRIEDELLTFVTVDGNEVPLFVTGWRKRDSNERAFLLDVPRILAGEVLEPPSPLAPPPRPTFAVPPGRAPLAQRD